VWGWLSLVPSESEVVGFLISISLADLLILATSPDTNQRIERRGCSWLRRPWSGKECLILAVSCNSAKSGEINNVVWSDCGFVFKILVMLAASQQRTIPSPYFMYTPTCDTLTYLRYLGNIYFTALTNHISYQYSEFHRGYKNSISMITVAVTHDLSALSIMFVC